MGLDQYAWAVTKKAAGNTIVDYTPEETSESTIGLAYWRKFNHLQGWMERLYRSKKGKKEPFNCTSVRLETKDLDTLELALKENTLEPTEGFFFGDDKLHEKDVQTTLKFIADARLQLSNDMAIFYDSWW